MPVQQIAYHVLRILMKTERWIPINDSTGSKILTNYNIKSLMLWACEVEPSSWWVEDMNIVSICVELLHILSVWLTDACCPHYFIDNCNLFDLRHNTHRPNVQLQLLLYELKSLTEDKLCQ